MVQFSLAVQRYPDTENQRRDNAVKGRDDVAAKMTPAQIAEAQELAEAWVKR
jgi:hypothetical protein